MCTAEDAYPEGSEDPTVAKITSEGVSDVAAYADHEGDVEPVEATAAAARAAAGIVLDEGPEKSAGGEGLEAAPSRPAATPAKKAAAKKAPAKSTSS